MVNASACHAEERGFNSHQDRQGEARQQMFFQVAFFEAPGSPSGKNKRA